MGAKASRTDVTAMQTALKDKGHDPGPVDGIMGPRTRAALRD
jgi:peptidoglycan hydrolase-like protein with peptidoglycan-binding domain